MCLTAPSSYLLLSECVSLQQSFHKDLWLRYRHNIDTFQRSSKITMAELENAKPILLPFAFIVRTCFLWFKYQCLTFCNWADFPSQLFYRDQVFWQHVLTGIVFLFQGGSAFSPASVISKRRARTQAAVLAEDVECPSSTPEEIVACLRQLPARVLNDAQTKVHHCKIYTIGKKPKRSFYWHKDVRKLKK